jgi:hypothetical protein
MAGNHPQNRLEIKKTQLWELWLITPSAATIIGSFNTLQELIQAQIVLYCAWEKPRLPRKLSPSIIQH